MIKQFAKPVIILILVATVIASGVGLLQPATAQQQAVSQQQAAAPAKPRTADQVIRELNLAAQDLRLAGGSPNVLTDEKGRAEVAPRMIPAMKKMVGLFEELMQVDPNSRDQLTGERWKFIAILTLLGDADSSALLTKSAEGAGDDAKHAKNMQRMVRWWQAGKDAARQRQVVEEVKALAKANPADEDLVDIVGTMAQQAVPEVKESIEKIILEDLKSQPAKALAQELGAERKFRELANKPLVIKAKKLDGSEFSSADWKGKVILVDVWATWCGPCIAELPRVVKVYEQWHPKGLEIVGVSCDEQAADLTKFLAAHKEMPWPQLFDSGKPGWHALAEEWGIRGIPTMLLIDKKGVVRTVEARENFEEMIPKLLEEN